MRSPRWLRQNLSFTTDSCKITSYCRICMGPIENPPDNHDHCIACLGLAHAEAALEESDCAQCAHLLLRVLRTRRNVACGFFGVSPTAANVLLVGPPLLHSKVGTTIWCKAIVLNGPPSIPRNLLRWLFPWARISAYPPNHAGWQPI